MTGRRIAPTLALLSALPSAALAHAGAGAASGFPHGFAHPLSGTDHLLAMVMVGVFAWQLGGRALWLVPSAFLLVMALGGSAGVAGFGLPFVEIGIALSVIVLGAVVAFAARPPVAVAMGVVALFAAFHGHAHGAEMPEDAGGLAYAAGFTVATALLHGVGLAVGFLVARLGDRLGPAVVRSAGGVAACAGAALLAGLL